MFVALTVMQMYYDSFVCCDVSAYTYVSRVFQVLKARVHLVIQEK